ncbi:MAG: class I adenylate-forming enzyme family protein, partial [Dehalococcoidia bacterium]
MLSNLGEILTQQAHHRRRADKAAIYFYDETYTYADLEARANRVARALRASGIGRGDVVCQMLPTSPDLIVNMFGVLKAGAIYSPLNPSLTDHELRYQLADSAAVAVITGRQQAGRFYAMRPLLPALRHIFVVDDEASLPALAAAANAAPPEEAPAPDDVALLVYTSGSTSHAKGVLVTHRSSLLDARQLARHLQITEDDRVLQSMPLFYYSGIKSNVLLPLLQGASIALRRRFVLEEFWPAVHRYRPTFFAAVPTMYARLL